MATSYSLEIIWATLQAALQLNPPFLPVTALTSGSAIGATTLSVADVRPFLPATILSFWDRETDQFTEPPVAVLSTNPPDQENAASPVPGTVTLDFGGQDHTSLKATHASGSMVATNVIDDLPVDIDAMLQNGYPVLAAFVLDRPDDWLMNRIGTRMWGAEPTLSLVYSLPYERPSGTPLHEQIWNRNLTHRAEKDLNQLTLALQHNYNLTLTAGIPHAVKLKNFRRRRMPNVERDPTPTWDEYLDIVVTSGTLTQLP